MKNGRMLYKHPGKHEFNNGWFDYIIVLEKDAEKYVRDGWFYTTEEAKDAMKPKATHEAEIEWTPGPEPEPEVDEMPIDHVKIVDIPLEPVKTVEKPKLKAPKKSKRKIVTGKKRKEIGEALGTAKEVAKNFNVSIALVNRIRREMRENELDEKANSKPGV